MKLHNRDIQKLFALSKLNINKDEQESLIQDLSSVLSWVGSLQSVNTKHTNPMIHPVPLNMYCKDDLPPGVYHHVGRNVPPQIATAGSV